MRIYIASKTRHARRWQLLAAAGVPICSTWIYEAGVGQTTDWTELWARCIREASTATAFLLYRDADDEILKGAYIELGAALASGLPCWYVGPDDGNVTKNGAIRRVGSINEALAEIIGPAGVAFPPDEEFTKPPQTRAPWTPGAGRGHEALPKTEG